MQAEQNVATEGYFNPNQKIDLSSSRALIKQKRAKKTNANRINFSEKINLKNYQGEQKQQVQKKSAKKQKKQKNKSVSIKLEHHEAKKESQHKIAAQPSPAEKIQTISSQNQQPISNQISNQDKSQLTLSVLPSSKITTTPIYHKNYNSITTKNIKIEPPPFYQPVRVNPMEKIELGQKIQRCLQSQASLITNPKQYKIRVLSSDVTSMRYQCFCSRQYLSYCAIYHHLKKDHFDFLKENRRFSSTNVQDTIDPVYGFKIRKITRERLKCQENESKEQIEKLPKYTKEKIKAQSQQIQQLLAQLKGIEEERDKQVQHLKLFQRKLHKAGELVSQYQNMIRSFQQIFNILNIRQITQKLNNGPTVFQENDSNDEEYFPQ